MYTEAVDRVLRAHEPSLRHLFRSVCTARGVAKGLLSFEQWRFFLRAVDLIAPDLSEVQAGYCFVWSRAVVANPYARRGPCRMLHLAFEAFLEALCRCAALKALPTDGEIGEHAHAAAYLDELRSGAPERYDSLLHERRNAWGAAPRQPLASCVAKLLSIIIYNIQKATRKGGAPSALAPLELTEKECESFFKKMVAT